MNKMAIFVEGQTEQIFIERLLFEVIGKKHLKIESQSASGGGRAGARVLQQIRVAGATNDVRYFVLIVESRADNRVRSDIAEQYESLALAGYSLIIGIRDVYPDVLYSDIGKLRTGLATGMKSTPVPVDFVLGVMEIESWFLSEHAHFLSLDASLTPARISTDLGWNPEIDDMQLRDHPASDLHDAYHLVGRGYSKSRKHVERTVDLLDYENLYVSMAGRIPDLDLLNSRLDAFLS